MSGGTELQTLVPTQTEREARARRLAFRQSIANKAAELEASKVYAEPEKPNPSALMTELQTLRDRVEELERAVGVDQGLTTRLRIAFGIEPALAPILGMLFKRNFVTHDSLYTVLYAGRLECDWPQPKIMDVQICKLRRKLKRFGIVIKTQWGEGWSMSVADKAKVRAVLDGDCEKLDLALRARRLAFVEGH
jgi:hypothetical protein